MKTVSYWMMGSLSGASWENNMVVVPLTILGVLFFWSQYRTLNLMLLGDESAITLGTDLHPRRQLYLLVASLMVGFAVYCAGVIGFVGLVIPHGGADALWHRPQKACTTLCSCRCHLPNLG